MTVEPVTRPQPIAGPLFAQAYRLPMEGAKRRKLLCLIAAYADAGVANPSLDELANRLGHKPRTVVGLLMRLEQDGLISRPKRRRITLHLESEGAP
jgi:DNA-binding MarR family transcriptional regulator